MRRLRNLLLAFGCGASLVGAGAAQALPLGMDPPNEDLEGIPGNMTLYQVYNAVVNPAVSLVSNADLTLVGDDEILQGDYVAVLLFSSASLTNEFGTYSDLGVGSALTPVFGPQTGFGFLDSAGDGTGVFDAEAISAGQGLGTYLYNSADWLWHSQSDIDAGGTAFDHLASYAVPDGTTVTTDLGTLMLSDARLLAWEDLFDANPPDFDYNDQVILVGRVVPVPEPAAVGLFGGGLLALGALGRRRACS